MVLFEESARGKFRVPSSEFRAGAAEGAPGTLNSELGTIRTKGWQLSGVEENMALDRSAYMPLTAQQSSSVILNCYPSGQHDEMHCHPNEEHVFAVWRGKLHLTGVEEGEDLTLERGQLVHIDANYYYRLHNPGAEPAVYFQFRTLPARPPKRRMVPFSESNRAKRVIAATG
jgi:mannose-6-phosphate isomerase-like protein (cupin superfamily)